MQLLHKQQQQDVTLHQIQRADTKQDQKISADDEQTNLQEKIGLPATERSEKPEIKTSESGKRGEAELLPHLSPKSTSSIEYRRGGLPTTNSTALKAPLAKISLVVALWLNSSRSPAPKK